MSVKETWGLIFFHSTQSKYEALKIPEVPLSNFIRETAHGSEEWDLSSSLSCLSTR